VHRVQGHRRVDQGLALDHGTRRHRHVDHVAAEPDESSWTSTPWGPGCEDPCKLLDIRHLFGCEKSRSPQARRNAGTELLVSRVAERVEQIPGDERFDVIRFTKRYACKSAAAELPWKVLLAY
jgi:hypothetical protein